MLGLLGPVQVAVPQITLLMMKKGREAARKHSPQKDSAATVARLDSCDKAEG